MTNTNLEIVNGASAVYKKVSVTTSARLHMGFFDLNGNLGRRFGSIGVSLQAPETSLLATPATSISVQGPVSARATKIAEQLMQSMALDGGVHIQIAEAIPEHSGLGSGTQLAVAIGMAISRLYDLNLTIKDIAVLTQRGMRSGIGLGTFLHGGLIVDGGRASNSKVPPVIAHADFPEDWPILLIFDQSHQGVHGAQEIAAFKELPEFPAESSAILCRHVLMQALPAIAERDLKSFGKAIQALQTLTGDYFAPAQGGARYTSPIVAQALTMLEQAGVDCFGQSSWGPTGFAVFENQTQAEILLQELKAKFSREASLKFVLTKANNQPSQLEAS
jgi:beta-RFAP synthase